MIDSRSNKLTKAQIAEMSALYETGEYSQRDLAEKYGISIPTANKFLQMSNSQKGINSEEVAKRVRQEMDKKYDEEVEKKVKDIKLTRDESTLWPRIVGNLIMQEVSKLNVKKDEKPLTDTEVSRINQKVNILKNASTALNNVMMQRWKALNIDEQIDEETIPELKVEDITQEALMEIHKKQRFNAIVEDQEDGDDIEEKAPEVNIEDLNWE